MFLKCYIKVPGFEIPNEILEPMTALDERGVLHPVSYGGALRDSRTGYKPIADNDFKCAGIKDPEVQDVMRSMLTEFRKLSHIERPLTNIDASLKAFFEESVNISVYGWFANRASFRITGRFKDSSLNKIPLDISVSCRTVDEDLETVMMEALGYSQATFGAIAANAKGVVMAHRRFDTDARNCDFRPQHYLQYRNTQWYFEKMKDSFPELTFKHNVASRAHSTLKQFAPEIIEGLKYLRDREPKEKVEVPFKSAPTS